MEDELYAEAVMVTDGIISKVGNFEYVMKFKDDGTSMYDLKGRTLMPSFIDPHSHITAFATTLKIADLSRQTVQRGKAPQSRRLDNGVWIRSQPA